MKLLLISILFCFGAYAKNQKIIFSEQGVFKVEDKVFLLSDIRKLGIELEHFRCLLPQSSVLANLGLDKQHVEKIPDFLGVGMTDLQEEAHYLDKVLKLMKLEFFSSKNNFVLDAKKMSALKNEECGLRKNYDEWPKDLRELFLLETFWNDRFAPEMIRLSEKELEDLKLKNPKNTRGINFNKIIFEEKKRRSNESAHAFIKTVEKQISHELFY